jgi:hypothetical protein
MKIPILIIVLIAVGGLIFCLISCKSKTKVQQVNGLTDSSNDSVRIQNLKDNPYEGLRKQAFDITPQQLELSVNDSEIYGVIMDWDLGNGIMTLITYKTGDASMYLSTGGGVIGGGQHENVNKAAKAFVSLAHKYFDKVTKIDSTPIPDKNCVRFYFLTSKGKYYGQEQMSRFENESSLWLEYFNEANKVITELKLTTEPKQ